MRDSRVVRLLRDLAGRLRGRSQTLLLLSPTITLPVELEKEVTMIEFPLPESEEIEKQIEKLNRYYVKQLNASQKNLVFA